MLQGMAMVLATWAVAVPLFAGVGMIVQRGMGYRKLDTDAFLSAFWIGWACVIGFLQVWHLFFRIDFLTTQLVALSGVWGLWLNRSRVRQLLSSQVKKKLLWGCCFFLFAVWLSNRAMGPLVSYDAGLYHLSAVQWATNYPAVPGLGNLHGRLAFNNSSFLYLALLDVGWWTERVHHVANGLLLLVAMAGIGSRAQRLLQEGQCRAGDAMGLVFLVPLVGLCLKHTSSMSPDLPVFLVGLVVMVHLCRLLYAEQDTKELRYDLFVVVLLSAVGVACKLSFLVFGAVASAIGVLAYLSRGGGQGGVVSFSGWPRVFLPAVAILAIWMGRGIVLSGYPAYPTTIGGAKVEWRVPSARARSQARWIKSWARRPRQPPDLVLADSAWVRPWLKRTLRDGTGVVLPMGLGFMGLGFVLWRRRRNDWRVAALVLPPAAALLFWFVMAPKPRFAGAAFWSLGAWGSVLAWQSLGWFRGPNGLRRIVGVVTLVALLGHWRHDKFISPGPQNGWYPITRTQVKPFDSDHGVHLLVPVVGNQCWNAPQPCTPYPNRHLSWRQDGNTSAGFVMRSDHATTNGQD